jgi:HSP20 family protein
MATEVSNQVRTIRPVGNICEEDGTVVLRLEMPGVAKNDISVNVDGDVLSIRGHRAAPEGGKYLVRERREGDFFQRYTLDESVNRDKIAAKMDNGVLTVTLHLKDEVKPRKIEVKAN